MIRKGFVIDTQKLIIERDVNYDDVVFDGLYIKDVDKPSKEGANILFAAFVFPEDAREEVQIALNELKAVKKQYDDLQAEIYYKRFRLIKDKALAK
jgi:hypothetical protein